MLLVLTLLLVLYVCPLEEGLHLEALLPPPVLCERVIPCEPSVQASGVAAAAGAVVVRASDISHSESSAAAVSVATPSSDTCAGVTRDTALLTRAGGGEPAAADFAGVAAVSVC